MSMLPGRGNGTFKAAPNYESGGQDANAIAAADLNMDGRLDLVVVSTCLSEPSCPSGAVGVLLGDRHGKFSNAVTYGSGGLDPHSVAIADVNGDGRPDLVVVNVPDAVLAQRREASGCRWAEEMGRSGRQ